ncbi:MAG: hypothetical protein ACQEQM_02650 [Thermoplasmatota archaeon]
MEKEKLEAKLDKELEDTPWIYRYWTREGTIELRNTGKHFDEDQIDEMFESFKNDLKKDFFKVLLEGKAGVVLEDGDYWLCSIDKEGGPGEKDKRLKKSELKDVFIKSLHRIDSGLIPSNIVSIEASKVTDIYREEVGDYVFVHIQIEDNPSITLRSDSGIQIRI